MGGIQAHFLAFKEAKKTECVAMQFDSQPAGDIGSIAKTFCSIHRNSQTVFFF